jgi:hypothetical protein
MLSDGRNTRILLVLLLFLQLVGQLEAQDFAADSSDTFPPSRRHDLRTAALVTTGYWIGAALVMEKVWYRGQERVPFHFFNDNGGYLQVDKLGHGFGAYAQSYVGYHWLRRAGMSRRNALTFGGALGLLMQTPIELMDGIHEGWGFSWGDMIANAAGSGLVAGQELLFARQLVKYKFSYAPSRYAAMANGYLGTTALERIFDDYNGHTYWLSFPANLVVTGENVPRWLNIAIGYSANGMIGEFDNLAEYDGVAIPHVRRYRQLLLSLDVDWTRIATRSPVLKTVFAGLTFVKLPFPALELSSGRLRGHGLYY